MKASWNFYLYSGRACPDNHDLWQLNNAVGAYEEFFCAPKQGLIDKEKNLGACPISGSNQSPVSMQAGNPIHVATGNKFQRETLYRAPAPSPLRFDLYYNSLATKGTWTDTYSRSISGYFDAVFQNYEDVRNISQAKYLTVTVRRADGRMLRFRNIFDWDARTTVSRDWSGDRDVRYRLESVNDEASGALTGFDLHTPEDTRERYDLKGRLQHILHADGRAEHLQYDANGKLTSVSDDLGMTLTFAYDATGTTLIAPDGTRYRMAFANGNLNEIVLPDATPLDDTDNPRRRFHYNEPAYTTGASLPAALTGITDERGIRYATYQYLADGRASASWHAGDANRIDIGYNDTTGARTVTNGRGAATTYAVTNQLGMALPRSVTGPACASCGSGNTSYSYDPATNNLLARTENGVTTRYGDYDSNGNYGYRIEAAGTAEERRTDYSYDPRFRGKVQTIAEPSVVAGLRKITTYDYDDYGNRTRVRIDGYAPDGQGGGSAVSRTTAYAYHGPLHQLSQIDGPRTDVADITTFNYYPDDPGEGANRARLREIVDAHGVTLRGNIQYTASGKVASEDRPNGLHISNTYYPGNDRLESLTETDTTNGQSRTTRWSYLATGEVETITQGDGTVDATTLTFGYDDARRLVRITDGLGNTIQYSLDTEGNKEREEIYDGGGALHKALVRTFDLYNRLDTTAQANESADYHFLPNGTLDSVTNGKGSVTDYNYDNLKRLTTITQDLSGIGALTQYGYDAQDNLTSVTDPINGNTRYVYDDLGNLLTQTSPDTGPTAFTYDEAGNLKTKVDAKGLRFSYTYDALNRLVLLDAPGTVGDIRYEYDNCGNGIGRICSITVDPSNTNESARIGVNYAYNSFGDVTSHQGIGYDYDHAGRLATITYPSGTEVTYDYDSAGQVNLVRTATVTLASKIQYHPYGPAESLSYGNNLTLSQVLDSAYHFVDITAGPALDLRNAQYDANGNLQQRNRNIVAESFTYDPLNRLDTASGYFGSRDYDYDNNGNRTLLKANGVTTGYGYAPQSNRLTNDSGWTYIHDANGNLTEKRIIGPTYDRVWYLHNVHNQLTGVMSYLLQSTGWYNYSLVGSYLYNGLGQRSSKQVNYQTTRYRYGLGGELLAELDHTGKPKREYIYFNGQPLAMRVLGDGPMTSTYHMEGYDMHGRWARLDIDTTARRIVLDEPIGATDCQPPNIQWTVIPPFVAALKSRA